MTLKDTSFIYLDDEICETELSEESREEIREGDNDSDWLKLMPFGNDGAILEQLIVKFEQNIIFQIQESVQIQHLFFKKNIALFLKYCTLKIPSL